MEFVAVFMWVCLALFVGAGAIWLLDMVRIVTIRSPAQRTILNAALGTTLIGGMASFAVGAFFTERGGAAAPTGPAASPASPSPPASVASSAVGPTSPPSPANPATPTEPSAPPAPPTSAPTACRPAAHPEFLAEWAAATLGTPPTFRCAIAAPYPVCIADLRETQLSDISREAALACGAQLLAFRQTHISSAYAAKHSYQDNLDAAEAGLRNPRNVEETARSSYVGVEIKRMNGVLWKDFTALDQRSKSDMLACQTDSQRCLTDQ